MIRVVLVCPVLALDYCYLASIEHEPTQLEVNNSSDHNKRGVSVPKSAQGRGVNES